MPNFAATLLPLTRVNSGGSIQLINQRPQIHIGNAMVKSEEDPIHIQYISAGIWSSQMAEVFAPTASFSREWAQVLQVLGICLNLTSLKSLCFSWMSEITQLIPVLLLLELLSKSTTSLQSGNTYIIIK